MIDPAIILARIEEIEHATDGLRRLLGFPTRPELAAQKAPVARFPCDRCNSSFFTADELDSHLQDWHA